MNILDFDDKGYSECSEEDYQRMVAKRKANQANLKSLYEITGDIKDINTLLINRNVLKQLTEYENKQNN